MPTLPPPRIAIVGSGPAGCYFAQTLVRAVPTCMITIFDRLVSPFGLIRYGVAADHQHTKAITRQFERLFQSPQVQFAGDIEIGRDVTLDELRAQFDAVVLATGLIADRRLDIAGAHLPGVVGAGTVTRTLNAHPDEHPELADLGTDVIIIGAGNVALDLLRFLVKGADDYANSDVADAALAVYLAAPAERITIVSRSDATFSKGDPQMLKELAALTRATYQCPDNIEPGRDATLDRAASARLAAIAELVSADRPGYDGPTVTLRFGADPTAITGTDRVTGLEISSVDGTETIAATSILTAIGFDTEGTAVLSELTATPSPATGRIEAGLYRTGWAKRGPHGAIPENRACAKAVAEELVADLTAETLVPAADKLGFAGLPEATQAKAISYADWLTLDAFEREQAPTGRVRRKLTDHYQMATIARGAAAVTTA